MLRKQCGHGISQINQTTGYCNRCRADTVRRNRKGIYLEEYRINRDLFTSRIPRGRMILAMELSGFSRDCMGQIYKGTGVRDAERRALLAKRCGVQHDDLWILKPRKNSKKPRPAGGLQ